MPDVKAEPDLSPQAKRDAIMVFESYIDDQLPFDDVISKARKLSRVKWYRRMLDDLGQNYDPDSPEMPYAPRDSTRHPLVAEAAAKRVVLFLKSGRHYDDGSTRLGRVCGCVYATIFLGSFLGFAVAIVFEDLLGFGDRAEPFINAFAITIGLCLLPLFIGYAVSLAAAAVHIFRVRVLRQDLRSKLERDIWPYLERADYEADLAVVAEHA